MLIFEENNFMKRILWIFLIISLIACSSDKKVNIDEKAPPVIAPQDSTISV